MESSLYGVHVCEYICGCVVYITCLYLYVYVFGDMCACMCMCVWVCVCMQFFFLLFARVSVCVHRQFVCIIDTFRKDW